MALSADNAPAPRVTHRGIKRSVIRRACGRARTAIRVPAGAGNLALTGAGVRLLTRAGVLLFAGAASLVLPEGLGASAPALSNAPQEAQGEEIFQRLCVMCHTVGSGDLIGPDLRGVEERRSEDWIIRFVQHSQEVVSEGDEYAVALFEKYQRVPMPDQALSPDEIRAVMAFTRVGESVTAAPLAAVTPEQVALGQELFQGTVRLANGGPSCNSCHDVINDAVIGGGILAKELTTVFTRLGGLGVRAIIGSPPFPVMQRAYLDRALTEEEVISLVGFLEKADAEQALHQPRDYGIKLFGAGVLGAVLLLGLYSVAWRGRKAGSVNQAIFDRQIKSV